MVRNLHNIYHLLRRCVRKMPGFSESILSHEVHPMHMTLRLLYSVCFQNLQAKGYDIINIDEQ